MNTRNLYDIAIAGAGPAGTSLAIRLANDGFSVVLIEQKKFPREKLCGEFISPECLLHFKDLGVADGLIEAGGINLHETTFFGRNGKGVSVKSEWFGNFGATALGLSRAEMDLQLLQRAKSCGVTVLDEASVTSLTIERERVVGLKIRDKCQNETEIFSRLCVDATGRQRALTRQLETRATVKVAAGLVAFKTHLRGATVKSGACEIYVYAGGYGGCNSVEDGLFNLCFIASAKDTKRLGSDAERVMREIVFSNKQAAKSMSEATVAKPWLAVPIERFGRGSLVPADGLLSVGDAAAFIDPFTGSGMLLALESGKILASTIANNFSKSSSFRDLAKQYSRDYSLAFDRRLKVCSMLRYAAFSPIIAETTISILNLNESLRRRVAQATRFSAGSAA